MKNVIPSLILLILLGSAASAQKKEFGWLIGTWKLKDKNIVETWTVDKNGESLNGISMKVVGSESRVLEETKLILSEKTFYYVADVTGDQEPVRFEITFNDPKSFVAENPNHDFPKLIRYKLVTDGDKQFIEAAIEGDGKIIPYLFEKVR